MINVARTIRGFRGNVLTWLAENVQERTPLSSPSVRVQSTPNGFFLNVREPGVDDFRYPALFDLYEVTATTFKVRGVNPFSSATLPAAFIGGTLTAVTDGADGYNLDDAVDIETEDTSLWVYLAVRRDDATCTFEIADGASAMPSGTDAVELFPLWFVYWEPAAGSVAGHIVQAKTSDLRGGVRWLAEGVS